MFLDKYKAIKLDEKRIKDYEVLTQKLENIHKNLSYDISVPISENIKKDQPLCFISGKLMHTNEVYMPIGDTHYTKLSTTDAAFNCQRKIDGTKNIDCQ